jgi:hypothetical protein
MLLVTKSPFDSVAASKSINRYGYCVRKVVATLFIVMATAGLPTTSSSASDAPAPARDPVTSADQGPGPKGIEDTQTRAFLPTGNAGISRQEVQTTRQSPSTEPGGLWRRVGGFPSKLGLAFGSAAMVLLLYLGWRPSLKVYRKAVLWFDTKALGVRQIVAIDDVDQNAVLTLAALHDRGWPLDVMEKVLGLPDYAVVDPTGRTPPLILLSRERVESLEKSGVFQKYCEMRTLQARATAAQISKWIALQEECVTCTGTAEGSV